MSLVSLSSHLINITLDLCLCLVKLAKLSIELLNGALGFRQSRLKFNLGHLKVLSLGKTFLFILGSPHICLLNSLSNLSQDIIFTTSFFLQLFLDAIKLMFYILEFAKQSVPFFCFIISNTFGLIQLSYKLDPDLTKHTSIVLKLLKLSQEISIFSSNFPLVVFKVTQSQVGLFNLLVDIIEVGNQILVGLLC